MDWREFRKHVWYIIPVNWFRYQARCVIVNICCDWEMKADICLSPFHWSCLRCSKVWWITNTTIVFSKLSLKDCIVFLLWFRLFIVNITQFRLKMNLPDFWKNLIAPSLFLKNIIMNKKLTAESDFNGSKPLVHLVCLFKQPYVNWYQF